MIITSFIVFPMLVGGLIYLRWKEKTNEFNTNKKLFEKWI